MRQTKQLVGFKSCPRCGGDLDLRAEPEPRCFQCGRSGATRAAPPIFYGRETTYESSGRKERADRRHANRPKRRKRSATAPSA